MAFWLNQLRCRLFFFLFFFFFYSCLRIHVGMYVLYGTALATAGIQIGPNQDDAGIVHIRAERSGPHVHTYGKKEQIGGHGDLQSWCYAWK